MKKALTYTIIAGSKACVNDCPICISKMTPDYGISYKKPEVDWDAFKRSTHYAFNHGAEVALITGKGEPALYPAQVTEYLHRIEEIENLRGERFDRREIQTEGSLLAKGGHYDGWLDVWEDHGLDVVALSIYHYDADKNEEVFRPKGGRKYFDLPELIEKLDSKGLKSRLSCVMLDGYIDCVEEVEKLIRYAEKNDVFQLTLRRADAPKKPLDLKAAEYVEGHRLSDEKFRDILDFLDEKGEFCYDLSHGAQVYEVFGQNVCVTTGLTPAQRNKDDIRQLIFFPQGCLTTSWENVKGGRVL